MKRKQGPCLTVSASQVAGSGTVYRPRKAIAVQRTRPISRTRKMRSGSRKRLCVLETRSGTRIWLTEIENT